MSAEVLKSAAGTNPAAERASRGSSASKGERRALAATVVTTVALIGVVLLALHLGLQDYAITPTPWYD